MIRRWLCWLLALLGVLVLRVAYTGWLAGFVLAAVACLPLLGLLTALPAVLSTRVTLAPSPERVRRGSPAAWRVTGGGALDLPLGRVKVSIRTENELNGLIYKTDKAFFLPGAGVAVDLPAPADHCGLLTGRLVHVWALDSLGLFWLPLRRGGGAKMWVEPVPQTDCAPSVPEEETPGVRPRPGGGPGEDYDPREYRPGDSLSSIHWKLSAKRDELITRETLETVKPLPLLTLDLFGTPEILDETLDILAGMGGEMLSQGRPFAAAWADPETGELKRFSVNGERDFDRCLEVLLSRRAPLTGRSVLDLAGLGRSLHLTPSNSQKHVQPRIPDFSEVKKNVKFTLHFGGRKEGKVVRSPAEEAPAGKTVPYPEGGEETMFHPPAGEGETRTPAGKTVPSPEGEDGTMFRAPDREEKVARGPDREGKAGPSVPPEGGEGE